MSTPPPLPEEYVARFRKPPKKTLPILVAVAGIVCLMLVCSHSAPPEKGLGDQSPITGADRNTSFDFLRAPLSVGDVGRPYSFEVLTVIDDSRAICKMRFRRGETSNAAVEKVWVFIPTAGLVSDHGYRFDKSGVASLAIDSNPIKDEDAMVFKVTGTANYGADALFVVKPVW